MAKPKAVTHESYINLMLVSVIVPIAGIILGIAYLRQDQELDKALGKHLLIAGIFFTLFWGLGGWALYIRHFLGQ